MTFEEFWLAVAEDDEFMEVLVQMANQHSEKAKREKETFEIDTANILYKNEMYKGIFISDKIFMVKDNGENQDIKDWLKIIIKEAVRETLNGIQIIRR